MTDRKANMKIVFFGHKYVPSREGGVEIVVENLAARLAAKGHDVTLLNRKRKQYDKIHEYRGCKVENVFTMNKRSLDAIVYALFATIRVKKLIKKRKVDVVHVHAEGPCNFLGLLKRAKKRYGVKIVVTVHGLDWQRAKWGGVASKIIKRGEKKAVRYADEIIVLSENNRSYFKSEYGRETVFIPNGVDKAEYFSPEIIGKKFGLSEKSYVLFLARIVPEKGLHFLVEAWKSIDDRLKGDKKLVVAGGNSHSDEYYNGVLKSIEGDSSIIATGFVQGKELKELFSNAYAYVLPSTVEGMPISLLEALSYGLPCLTSDIPENKEVLSGEGLTFKSGDACDLKYKLEKVLVGGLGKADTLKVYSWDEVTDMTLGVYGKQFRETTL